MGTAQKNPDPSLQKSQAIAGAKTEEGGPAARPVVGEVQSGRPGQVALGAKGQEEGTAGRSSRSGSGNAGQGYTSEEVITAHSGSYFFNYRASLLHIAQQNLV